MSRHGITLILAFAAMASVSGTVVVPALAREHGGALSAKQHGYEHGYREGYRRADRGYERYMGEHDDFQHGYRDGYKAGYDDGFYARPGHWDDVYGIDSNYDP